MASPIQRLSWDDYFLSIAKAVAQRSECLDKKVGCVIVDERKRILATGYNGMPPGQNCPCLLANECLKDVQKESWDQPPVAEFTCPMVHAELNALLQCDVSRAHTLYCTLKPCDNCQAHIEAAGIKRVVFPPMVQLAQFLETTACVAKPSPYEAVSKRMFSSKPEQAELTLRKMFSDIASYHTTLGYPRKPKNLEDRKQMTVEIGLALHQEVAELIDSFDWKPWKDGLWDRVNTKEEMIDIFFFLGSLLELFNILPRELEEAFELKLEKNYNRIRSGYNKEMK